VSRLPNPVRLSVLAVGLGLARAGIIERRRAVETTRLAWPRIVTGLARMSKGAVDIAMVGVAVGSTAIAGVGFANPFWAYTWIVGAGVAGGTIALVSQCYGADAHEELGLAVRSSVILVLLLAIPVAGLFWTTSEELISLLTDNPEAIRFGSRYLQVAGLGVPFAALNFIGSRVLVGADDAYSAMQIRAAGSVVNMTLNGVLIFVLGLGVVGAALGTALASVLVTLTFATGLALGRLPLVGQLPVQISPVGAYTDPGTIRDLIKIGLPLGARNLAWNAAQYPMLAILNVFGQDVVAGYVIARRIWGLLNTPGWGFGMASTSLVGQELGTSNETEAELYGRDIIRFALGTYLLTSTTVVVFAEPIVGLFVNDPTDPAVPIAVTLVYVSCLAVPFQGIAGSAAGPLNASGDTRVPFVSRVLGMFCVGLPLAYLGATTPLGIWGVYLAVVAESTIPAGVNYWRFSTGKWKQISRQYRPESPHPGD
jgi:putative MATE family efflux protein